MENYPLKILKAGCKHRKQDFFEWMVSMFQWCHDFWYVDVKTGAAFDYKILERVRERKINRQKDGDLCWLKKMLIRMKTWCCPFA